MWRIAIIIFAGFLALGVTGPKLIKMAQIKGWVTGAEIKVEEITQKWNQTPDIHPSGRNTFWISWGNQDISVRGNHRTNVEKEIWDSINIGDKIELVYVPGDTSAYLKDGIFVGPGNFIFDIVLLLGELTTVFIFIIQLIKSRRFPSVESQQR
ncbi:MAG TPA: hypothetical protein VIO64_17265 [Pseudobacteroides sp.]|uniref:hypothetical protein n=1 Tax=Pseudobacteroides sp. TaxID=1968840 RepID=UPI002F952BD3